MLIIDIIRHTLRGLVTAVAAVTVIAGAVLLLLMGWLLRLIAPGRYGVRAPKVVNLSSFVQNLRETDEAKEESERIPYKIDKDFN